MCCKRSGNLNWPPLLYHLLAIASKKGLVCDTSCCKLKAQQFQCFILAFQGAMAVVPWLGLICGAFVASSPLANTPTTLALLASNQTSHLRPNGSALDMVNIGGPQAAVTSNNSRLGDDAYRCSSQTYGRPLAEGCKEAYEALSDTSDLLSFRARTAAPELGNALPLRSISCEQST